MAHLTGVDLEHYRSGTLPAKATADIEMHLSTCDRCARLLAGGLGDPSFDWHLVPSPPGPQQRINPARSALQIFLCHASEDKPLVRELYHRLSRDGFQPWLDEVAVLPGQEWREEIAKAVRASHVVLVCLTKQFTAKAGFVHTETKLILDVADEQPEGTIFLIPVKLQGCTLPERLKRWQWVDLMDTDGYNRLLRALDHRAAGVLPKTAQGPLRRDSLRPAWNIAHPLVPAPDYQNRSEDTDVREFWKHRPGGVFALIGIGGAGKTALAERFLRDIRTASHDPSTPAELPRPDALFVWSFYTSPKSDDFTARLTTTLQHATSAAGTLNDIVTTLSTFDNPRVLVILDGLEAIQETDGGSLGLFGPQAKGVREFLRDVAGIQQGIWLIATSRFPIADLNNWRGNGYWPTIMDRLPAQSASALLRTRGVKGTEKQLLAVAAEFGYHALTLSLVATLASEWYNGNPQDILGLRSPDESSGGAETDLEAKRLSRVLSCYDNLLTDDERGLLQTLSAFRLPIDEEFIGAIVRQGSLKAISLPNGAQLPSALSRLVGLRLVQRHDHGQGWHYSLHPAVGYYFYRALGEDALLLHDGAVAYLTRRLGDSDVRVNVRGAVRTRGALLRPRIDPRDAGTDRTSFDLVEELIHHVASAGRIDEAYSLYASRLGGLEHLRSLGEYERGLRIIKSILRSGGTANSTLSDRLSWEIEQYRRFIESS
jgi:hypothetical protein